MARIQMPVPEWQTDMPLRAGSCHPMFHSGVNNMQTIGKDLKAHVPAVIAEWERLSAEEPWHTLAPEESLDSLPDVVVALAEASLCTPSDEAAQWQCVSAAAQHGEDRRKQATPEHCLLGEYHVLRMAIWRYLTRTFGHSDRTTTAIMRIDTAISMATNASLYGYHRAEIEARGAWKEGLERILATSPFRTDPERESGPEGGATRGRPTGR